MSFFYEINEKKILINFETLYSWILGLSKLFNKCIMLKDRS